jgi:aspartate/methionine/tyrosine aminotransferase
MINTCLETLTDYPFGRLAALLDGVAPPPGVSPVALSVGEPQHAPPPMIAEVLARESGSWNRYPPIAGTERLREAARGWLGRRYGLPGDFLDPGSILPLSGTREGLFLTALLAMPGRDGGGTPAVLLPNPFYACYEGAAVMAGAEPVFLDATAATGFLPDLDALDDALLRRTRLFYLCSPANPQGVAADRAYLARAIALARRYGFILAVDECYAEIYDAEPPCGVLEVAAGMDGGALDNLMVFHSLSKRSSAAGLRSGFVAGDPALIRAFQRLRSYSAASMPVPIQEASAALWDDDAHAAENRARYRAKIDAAERALDGRFGFYRPPGGFFLWLNVGDGEAAARALWARAGLKVLPGAYITRAGEGRPNPGAPYVRVALVHETDIVAEALGRFAEILAGEDRVAERRTGS